MRLVGTWFENTQYFGNFMCLLTILIPSCIIDTVSCCSALAFVVFLLIIQKIGRLVLVMLVESHLKKKSYELVQLFGLHLKWFSPPLSFCSWLRNNMENLHGRQGCVCVCSWVLPFSSIRWNRLIDFFSFFCSLSLIKNKRIGRHSERGKETSMSYSRVEKTNRKLNKP